MDERHHHHDKEEKFLNKLENIIKSFDLAAKTDMALISQKNVMGVYDFIYHSSVFQDEVNELYKDLK